MNSTNSAASTSKAGIPGHVKDMFLDNDSLLLKAYIMDDELTISVTNDVNANVMPDSDERKMLREQYSDLSRDLLEIVGTYSGNEKAFQFGSRVLSYTNDAQTVVPEELFEILTIQNVSKTEALAYTAFARVYNSDRNDPPDDVSPFVVQAIADQYSSSGVVRSVVNEIRSHPEPVENGTLTVFSDLDDTNFNLETIANRVSEEDVTNPRAAIDHLHLFTRQETPSIAEGVIEELEADTTEDPRGELFHPDEQDTHQSSEPADEDVTTDAPTTESPAENDLSNDPVEETSGGEDVNALEKMVSLLEEADEKHTDELDKAWEIGRVLLEGKEKHDIPYSQMVENADISFGNQKTRFSRSVAELFDYQQYPEDMSVDAVYRIGSKCDSAEEARDAILRASEIDRRLTGAIPPAWAKIDEFSLNNVLDVVEEQGVGYTVATTQVMYRLEGLPAPSEETINLVLNGDDHTPEEKLVHRFEEIDENMDGCDRAWQHGNLIHEFTTNHDFTYEELREVTGMARSKENTSRTLYEFYEFEEYPDNWSPTAIRRAVKAMDIGAEQAKKNLDMCAATGLKLTSTAPAVTKRIDEFSLAEAAKTVNEENASDPTRVFKLVSCLHGQDPPTDDLAKMAIQNPNSDDLIEIYSETNTENVVENDEESDSPEEISPSVETPDEGGVETTPTNLGDTSVETVDSTEEQREVSDKVVQYMSQFQSLTTLVTSTGGWTSRLNDHIDSLAEVNPSPKHFQVDCDDNIEHTTVYALTELTDAPLFLPSPAHDANLTATAVMTYAAGGGETVLYLGEFPPTGTEEARNFFTELTREFTYATSVEPVQAEEGSEPLHVFTKDGVAPE